MIDHANREEAAQMQADEVAVTLARLKAIMKAQSDQGIEPNQPACA